MGKRMDFKAYGKLNVILWEELSYGKINVIFWENKCPRITHSNPKPSHQRSHQRGVGGGG